MDVARPPAEVDGPVEMVAGAVAESVVDLRPVVDLGPVAEPGPVVELADGPLEEQEGPLVRDPDEDMEREETPAPVPVGIDDIGLAELGGAARRCAVIVGDDTLGVGPKDARDFEAALRRLPEWRPPVALYRTIFANATKQSVGDAVRALHGRGCLQMVFFYSGHGSNRQGDRAPLDEAQDPGTNRDEYLSLRNRQAVSERSLRDDRRIYDDELAEILRAWQVANRTSRPVPGSGGRQRVFVYPELLVILHACRSGGFVGGQQDLDLELRDRFEILMGSGENELCRARAPVNGVVQNSLFVGNILAGMSLAGGDRDVTGKSLFQGADDETTRAARQLCRVRGGCGQTPARYFSLRGDGTITLHARGTR
ncbi:MAG TPA: hypothetical protein VHQ65_11595 [Thermoanaerobaculia bacterium]|nr:hypothetical protein [Thermoanaerobaculia bacterium]